MMRHLRSISLVLLDQSVVSGTSFATTIVVARKGGPAELAMYALAITLLLLIRSIHEALVAKPYEVYVHKNHGVARAVYRGSAFASMTGLAVTAALGLLAAGLLLPEGVGPAGLAPMLVSLAVVSPCWLLREFARRTAIADLAFGTGLRLDVWVALAQLGSLAWLAGTGRLSGLTALFAVAAASAAGGLGWLVASRGALRIQPRHVGRHWRRNWRLGRWILASGVMGQLNSDMTMTWLLLFLAGPVATGLFAACMTVVFLSNPIAIGTGLFLTPRIAKTLADNGITEASKVVWQLTVGLGVVFALFVGSLALLADPIMQLMYGSQFAGHEVSVVVLAVAVAMVAGGLAASSGLLAVERADLNLLASVCGFVVLAAVAPALIVRWGVLGAGLALVAGNTVATAARLRLFWRQKRAWLGAHPERRLGARYGEELT